MNILTMLTEKEQTLKSWNESRKFSSNFHISDVPYSACHSSFTYLLPCVVLQFSVVLVRVQTGKCLPASTHQSIGVNGVLLLDLYFLTISLLHGATFGHLLCF